MGRGLVDSWVGYYCYCLQIRLFLAQRSCLPYTKTQDVISQMRLSICGSIRRSVSLPSKFAVARTGSEWMQAAKLWSDQTRQVLSSGHSYTAIPGMYLVIPDTNHGER